MNRVLSLMSIVISSLFLAGCWDRYDLEERANILGLAVDVVDEEARDFTIPETTYKEDSSGEQGLVYKLTAQMAVPGKIKLGPEGGGNGSSSETAWVIQTAGYSMKDAMMNLQQQLAEKLYLGHLQIIIVSEDIAKHGINDINDFLQREYEVRRTAWMVVSEGDAEEVLQAAPPIETVPALYLSDTLENAMRFGKLPREYMGKFWVDFSDIGVDGILPFVKLIEKERILVNGMAYFKGDKMVGNTNPFEIGAYLALKGENPGGYSLSVSSDDNGVVILESHRRKSKIKVNVQNGVPSVSINVREEVNLEEQIKTNNITDKKITEIEREASKILKDKFISTIKKWQESESDILGIGARLRAKYPKYWGEKVGTEEKWGEIYKEMDIRVNVECEIERTGMEWK